MAAKAVCKIDGCDKTGAVRGWCHQHYKRWKQYGDPLLSKKTGNGEAIRFIESALNYESPNCLFWPFARNRKGYAIVGAGKLAARQVCEKVHGPAPTSGHQAAHSCGNGHLGCISKQHLTWKTQVENELDKSRHGSRRTKLTEHQVRQIRSLGDVPSAELASRFQIGIRAIADIRSRRTWAWLTE